MILKPCIRNFAILAGAALMVVGCMKTSKKATQKPGGEKGTVESKLPVIADIEPSVEVGVDVTMHVISTRSKNPFLLEPDAAVQTAKLRTVSAALGLKGGVNGRQIVEAINSLGIDGIQEIRLSSIAAVGQVNPLSGGAVAVTSDESEWFTQYLCADKDQKLHLVVIVQLPTVERDETKP